MLNKSTLMSGAAEGPLMKSKADEDCFAGSDPNESRSSIAFSSGFYLGFFISFFVSYSSP